MSVVAAGTYAGLVAASNVVVARRLQSRRAPLVSLPRRLRPSGLEEVAGLLRPPSTSELTVEAPERRLARLTSVALLYAARKPVPGLQALLREEERPALLAVKQLHEHVRASLSLSARSGDRSVGTRDTGLCPYCQLSRDLLYGQRAQPVPFLVVNHSAHVVPSFDPDTNVSTATIRNYQILVPKDVAFRSLLLSHPVRWTEGAPELFLRSDPLPRDNPRARPTRPTGSVTDAIEQWQRGSPKDTRYLFEAVTWPYNSDISCDVSNVIRIDDFETSLPADASPNAQAREYELSYRYSLQSCIHSNYGFAWEPSGLDIDAGFYEGRAEALPSDDEALAQRLPNLTLRDFTHLRLGSPNRQGLEGRKAAIDEVQRHARPVAQSLTMTGARELRARARELEQYFGTPFWLLTISASKRLRFTTPRNGPVELWDMLTYSAPAMLFVFLNRAVCQTPQLLATEFQEMVSRHQ